MLFFFYGDMIFDDSIINLYYFQHNMVRRAIVIHANMTVDAWIKDQPLNVSADVAAQENDVKMVNLNFKESYDTPKWIRILKKILFTFGSRL